jgi:hypothetical protein
LLAHTDKFVQAEVLKNGLLWASARELGDHGTFLFHRRSDGRYAFQAQNGRFVVVHGAQGRLVAIGDSTQADAWFTPAPLPPGYH